MSMHGKNLRAFTLVEVLAVMSIMALLAAITLSILGRVKGKQQESRVKAEMAAIQMALENYKSKNGQYPPSAVWSNSYPITTWRESLLPNNGLNRNNLYQYLVQNEGRAFLPDLKESQCQRDEVTGQPTGVLTATIPDGSGGYVVWGYNSVSPIYNKNSYDLWVEYGQEAGDGIEEIVRVISNWDN